MWQGALDSNGYSSFRDGSKVVGGHVWSYRKWVGEIPHGMEVDHVCENRRCVNPDHLRLVGRGTNTVRNSGPTAKNFQKTHCDNGHPLEGDNLLIDSRNYRVCKECQRARQRRYRARQQADSS